MLKKVLLVLSTLAITAGVSFGSAYYFSKKLNLGAAIPIVVANFHTSLQDSITASDTSMTLVSDTDTAGTSISGYMCFTLDEGTASEEHVCGTAAGTAVTGMLRGISPQDGNLEVAALKKTHRRGASVKMTDFPILGVITRQLNGQESLPNKLYYTSDPTFVYGSHQFADWDNVKDYADSLTYAGAPDATLTVKGVSELATVAEINAGTGLGGTSARLFINPSYLASSNYATYLPSSTQKLALAGSSGTPSGTNLYITADDVSDAGASGKIIRANGTVFPTGISMVSGQRIGDLFYGGTTTSLSRLASGSAGAILTMSSGVPAWVTYVSRASGSDDDDDLFASAPTEQASTAEVMTKVKEFVIPASGSYFFTWDFHAGSSGTASAQIYKDGVLVGVEKESSSSTYAKFTDLIAGWHAGNLAQLYVFRSVNGNGGATVRNFKLYGTFVPNVTVNQD